jgi:class 3 adenylate cyclase
MARPIAQRAAAVVSGHVQPETRYAKSGDLHIAYQVVGSGPRDLVFVPGFVSHLDLDWDNPVRARALERLGSFARLIRFDKRGTGLSDRVGNIPTLEERMDDVRAVMDAVGCKRATMLGVSEGGPMSLLFAAACPDRVDALVLYGTYAHFASAVMGELEVERYIDDIERNWGTGASITRFAPSLAGSADARTSWARWERACASPAAVIALTRMNLQIDVRHVLPSIRVPTLSVHRAGDTRVSARAAREMASRIEGAKYVEFPGVDHVWWAGDTDAILDEIEEFLTGSRAAVEPDRILATVLFTDIVGSTEHVRRLGDRSWRDFLASFEAAGRRELARFRGREVKALGDGLLATFDGPARAVRCAEALRQAARELGVELRAGVHTGEIELRGHDIGGIAVHIAARVAERAAPGEVLTSGTVKDLVAGSGLCFAERGREVLRGLAEPIGLYAATA